MVIISKSFIKIFGNRHKDSMDPLIKWYEITRKADWKNYHELKNSFNTTDSVGNNRYVFNIKGNTYRLIALILFKTRTVFIVFIGTHGEYNNIQAKNIEYEKQ